MLLVTFSRTENFHIEIFVSEMFSVYSESHWEFHALN
ncbi:hypothetical protein Nmel_000915 [Mimus melanotis]